MLLSVMQAASHVNRICLPQSGVSVRCFHAYSKGSRVSLQSTQTSWTFPWLRVLLSYYLSPVHRLRPAPAPALADRTVCSGHVGWSVLFWRASCYWSSSRVWLSLTEDISLNWGIYERVARAKKPTQCCRKLWERQGHKHNQCNNTQAVKKTDTKQSSEYWKRSSDVVNTKSKVNL